MRGPVAAGPGGWCREAIELEVDGAVGYLRFNRPDSRNGVVAAMLAGVREAWLPLGGYLNIDSVRHQGMFRGDALERTWVRLAAQAAGIRGPGPAEGPARPGPRG